MGFMFFFNCLTRQTIDLHFYVPSNKQRMEEVDSESYCNPVADARTKN